MNDYLERQEGPDGQYCDLLTRVPYDRQRMIETALARGGNGRDAEDAAFRGMLWECSVKDILTGATTDDANRAGAEVIQPWRERAVELYNAWFEEAMPGPKGSTGKQGSPTRTSRKTDRPSATSAPR